MITYRDRDMTRRVGLLLLSWILFVFPLAANAASIWNASDAPSQPAVTDGRALEIGVKFRADVAGQITGLRFYKGAANTGQHVGNLWTRTGTLLASATFTGETASGWQEVQFSSPVTIQAGTTYVASYHSSSGYFALSKNYFVTDRYNAPLRALASGVDGGNGVFRYGTTSGFPTLTVSANNYWVDVVFTPDSTGDAPPTVTNFTVPATSSSLTVPITSLTATDDVGVTGFLVNESSATPSPTAGGWSATAPTSYTFATSGAKTLYAWAKDTADNVSAGRSASVTIGTATTGPEPAGWYAGDMHVHTNCGGTPRTMQTMLNNMAGENLKVISLLADCGNGEVLNPVEDLPKVNGQNDPISTADRTIHWDAEWHWDATFTQFPHQALGGHVVTLGLTEAHQIWEEYTYPIFQWARQQNGIAGFGHMQHLDNSIPQTLTCCKPIEYPVEVALGTADFISEDITPSDSFINAYYRLLNTGFRPGFAAGSDYPCSGAPLGALLTYVQVADGQFTYRNWIEGIAQGRTVISTSHNEFLQLTVDGHATPGDQINLTGGGSMPVTIEWTANQNLTGTIELVQNGTVVASVQRSVSSGAPASLSATVDFTKSGWLAARRMGGNGHEVHTAAVFVIVDNAPVRTSVADAEFYVAWMDNLLTKTAPGGAWNSFFPTNLAAAQARYQQAKAVFQQRAIEAGGGTPPSEGYSIWNDTTVPSQPADNDGQPIEVGVKFRADVAGSITALRFYKGAANTGLHIGHLWTRTGTLLASATFVNETASGWQEVQLSAPVTIQAGATYVASYHSSSGYFALDQGYFVTEDYTPPLRALANGVDGGNGVYKYGTSGFPTQTANANNYWVDVVFSPDSPGPDTIPPSVTAFTIPATATSLTVPITSFTATDNVGVTGYLVTESAAAPDASAAGWSATAPTSYTFASAGSKTLYAWAKDAAGLVSVSRSASVTVTIASTPSSIWSTSTVPSQPAVTDGRALEVGVKFRADVAGQITGLRFYKGAANTGTHVGHLWSRTGTLLATATFTNETASGWQEVQLATPVTIQAGTTYVASYHSSSGYFALDKNYFTTERYNPPLRALANGADGGNGVYRYGTSGFPTSTASANNYWVDVVFSPSSGGGDTIQPTVSAFTVPATATNLVVPITSFTATDNVGVTGYLVNESSTAPLPTAAGWSATAQTSYAFTSGGTKTLYAWAKDAANLVSASRSAAVTITITDTTRPTVTAFTLPATATSLVVTINSFTASDNVGVTGYLVNESSAAPPANDPGWSATAQTSYTFASTGSKTLYAWAKDATGNVSVSRSASVNVTGSDPTAPSVTAFTIPATANTLTVPITTFTATDNIGVTGYLVNESSATPDANAAGWSATAQTSYTFASAGSKTLYAWAKDGAGNVSTSRSASVNITVDPTAPVVTSALPPDDAPAVSTGTSVSVVFSKAMTASTITGTTFELRNSSNTLVTATVTYDSTKNTATLTPSSPLTAAASYTAIIKGGANGVKDSGGNPLTADYAWNFTSSASSPFGSGPGGPILVITSTANPFSRYVTEILQAEGFNAFAVRDISTVTATLLAQYDIAILGNIPLTSAQVTTLTNWVTGGGNLIAMRPDKQLAGLLGLVDAGATLAEGYLLVNTATVQGAGIVGQTIQYHGTADRYTLGGAASLATLYTNATTATANPAVTLRNVGSNGGQAAAFTFDLPRSVVYTRQGNPSWVNQERDGRPPTRANDLFYGPAISDPQPNWIDLTKMAIPQADEQQRLLANMIITMNADMKPLPRFWYFPNDHEAVIIMTGDDHGNLYGDTGTVGRFEIEKTSSPPGCSIDNWTCIRSSSYLITDYPAAILSDAQASAFSAEGFELGAHVNSNCAAYTSATIEGFFRNQTNQLQGMFPSLPPQVSHRQHCVAWSDYTTLPEEEVRHGIRLDVNYYYFPPNWAATPGFFTGSGMPMRFAGTNGALIDVYQATTQMTDESGQTYPATVNTLLDRAIGPEKYYGVFTVNMHTDYTTSANYSAIISSAQARGVPVIAGRQMLKWLDGRNGSSFSNLTWSNNVLQFTISRGQGATGLQAMVPIPSGLDIAAVTYNNNPVSYSRATIKGIEYAVFPALAGAYSVNMNNDTTAPTVVGNSPPAGGVNIPTRTTATATFSEPMAAATINVNTFTLRNPSGTAVSAAVTYNNTNNMATLTPAAALATNTRYTAVVSGGSGGVTDSGGTPLANNFSWSFTTAAQASTGYSIWNNTTVPTLAAVTDRQPLELGVKFQADVAGYITGLRFYKGAANTGLHVGHLWTRTGTLLASATFTNETASGWQEVQFATPVAIQADTTYVASYHSPSGYFALNSGYFTTAAYNPPLIALANGDDGGNGVYKYGASSFPTLSVKSNNYWVDVVFTPLSQ